MKLPAKVGINIHNLLRFGLSNHFNDGGLVSHQDRQPILTKFID